MKRLIAIAMCGMLALCGVAYAQVYSTPLCSFGTTTGTCIQGAGNAGTPSAIILTNATGLPSIVLQVSLASNQAVSDSTNTVVKFDTVGIDTLSGYSAASGRYTPTRAGNYLVCATAQGSVATLVTAVFFYISKNGLVQSGSTRVEVGPLSAAAGGTAASASLCRVVALNGSTDTVEADINIIGSGGSDAVAGNATPYTTMSISYLGT